MQHRAALAEPVCVLLVAVIQSVAQKGDSVMLSCKTGTKPNLRRMDRFRSTLVPLGGCRWRHLVRELE